MKTLGLIGFGGHARRILKSLEPNEIGVRIFHPTRLVDDPRSTQDFDEIRGCDGVIIASPNDTHMEYLRALGPGFKGHVLCEKPLVTRVEDLHALEDGVGPKRIMVDFPYIRSRLMDEIRDGLASIGRAIDVEITVGHGLAFRPAYLGSWRADVDRHPLGPLETVGIHFIHMAASLFGWFSEHSVRLSNVSGNGSAPDTSSFSGTSVDGTGISILSSYAIPYTFDVRVRGTDGFLDYSVGRFRSWGPRDTFDDGMFTFPLCRTSKEIHPELMYEDGVARTASYFIDVVRGDKEFDGHELELAKRVTQLLCSVC